MPHKPLDFLQAANGALWGCNDTDCAISHKIKVTLWNVHIAELYKPLADKRADKFLPKLRDEYRRKVNE